MRGKPLAIYLLLFFSGLAYLVVSALLGSFFDSEGDFGEGHGDGEGLEGGELPSPFSPRTLAATATGFGAGGGLALLNGAQDNVSMGFAVAGGLLMGGTAYGFLVWLTRQQRSSHLRREDLIGLDATVVTEIGLSSIGQVVVFAGGQTSTYLARSTGPTAVPRGARVRIEGISGEGLLVRMADEG
jgi:membrane protein implicated in regulation of membrane protease activity